MLTVPVTNLNGWAKALEFGSGEGNGIVIRVG